MLAKARIAVFVSGGGTNLQALIDALGGTLKSGEISLVISNSKDAYALQRAQRAGIPAYAVALKGAAFEARAEELLSRHKADVVVLAGFLRVLSDEFVSRYRGRMINIHPSLIPAFCGKGYYGLRVHEEVLKRGVKITGATVHYVNEIPDGGEIILQKAVEVHGDDTPETLQRRVMELAEWELLPAAAELVCRKVIGND
ncbi:MAG: phosphoribosylglycinamide formyltransferase [Clostridia bacterium]|nr:phosphoribosylglycinamide formyltransferase [Clostridia bacterium]